MSSKLPKSVLVRCDLIGTVSERAVLLYSLLSDLMHLSEQNEAFHDDIGEPFVLYPVERVAGIFHIGETQARQTFKELESAGLIVRVQQGCGKPSRIYISEVTSGKPTVLTSGKPTVKTSGKPLASQYKESIKKSHDNSSSGGEICENQTTFDDLFLMMTVKDVVSEILCKLCAENHQEFAEINAEIINFVAENIRKAAETKKIANIKGYARQALRHGKTDFENAQKRPEPPKKTYKATYDIAAYESVNEGDSPEWD